MELARRFALALQHIPLRVEQGVEGVLEIERFVDAVPTERAQAVQDEIATQPHAGFKREAASARDEPGVERDSTAPVSPAAQPEMVVGEERAPMGAPIDVPTREADPQAGRDSVEAGSVNDSTSEVVEAERVRQAPLGAARIGEAPTDEVQPASPTQSVQRQAKQTAEQSTMSPGSGKPARATDEIEERVPEKTAHRASSHGLQTVEPHARPATSIHEVPERKSAEAPRQPAETPSSNRGSRFALDELAFAPARIPAVATHAPMTDTPPRPEVPRLEKLSQWLHQPAAVELPAAKHDARSQAAESVVASSVAARPNEESKAEMRPDEARPLAASDGRRSAPSFATPKAHKARPQVIGLSSEAKIRIGSLSLRFAQPAPAQDPRRGASADSGPSATGERPYDLPPHSFVS